MYFIRSLGALFSSSLKHETKIRMTSQFFDTNIYNVTESKIFYTKKNQIFDKLLNV